MSNRVGDMHRRSPIARGRILRETLQAFAKYGICVIALHVCGCSQPSASESQGKASDVIRHTVERGPLRVTTEVSPAEPRLSDEPTFTLIFDYEDGVLLTKPPFGSAVGDFEILSFREPPATTSDGRQIEKQVYRLEPTTAGELKIAPFAVTFRDARPDIGDGEKHELTVEEVVVPVTTMLGDAAPQLSDLRPAAPPVQMPMQLNYSWLGLLLVPLLLIGMIVWWTRRKPPESLEPIYTPREIAEGALRELERSNMAESDTKRFYVELTGIVRRYLEQTTGVRAPEQTTEEFLRNIANNHSFQGEQRDGLEQFLQSADLVKFAGHKPLPEDVGKALERARRFIQINWAPPKSEVAV